MSSYDKTFKILFLSDIEVDKSVMFSGYLTYSPQPDDHNTIGIEFHIKTLVIDKKKYKIQLWDLTEMERFRFLLPTYCLGANAAVLLYDVTRSQTLDNIGEWANIVRQKGGDIPIMLVGIIPNEKKERQVSTEQGKEIPKLKNLNGFIECSIKTKENIEQVFEVLTRLMVANKGYNFVIAKKRDDRFSLKSKERTKISSPKIPSKPPLSPPPPPPPPPPKPPGTPTLAPQGRGPYRDQIFILLSKIQRFWPLQNSRIIAVTLVQGRDTILYSSDNRDISIQVGRLISNWSSLNAQFIVISGVKYSVLKCTPEILIATSIRGEDHILLAKDEDYTLILHVEPNGEPNNDDNFFPYPYIFKPPEPPDDFAMAPQVQLRAPLKEKEPEEEIYCQYCGRKLTKEDQTTHSCKKKPE